MHLLLSLALLGVPQTRVPPRSYPSATFGGERRVFVYTPADARAPAGLIICLWGAD